MRASHSYHICTCDPFGEGRPAYTFRSRCDESPGLLLADKAVRKFFNTAAREREKDMAIKAFLEYTCNKRPADDLTGRIDALVASIKRQETSRKEYTALNIHDQDTFRRGRAEGLQKAKIETARNLLSENIPPDIISRTTAIPLDTVEQLRQEMPAAK